jgi:hypothetical protein
MRQCMRQSFRGNGVVTACRPVGRECQAVQRVSILLRDRRAAVQADCRPSPAQTARQALMDSEPVSALLQRFENSFRLRLEPARARDSRLAGMLS